MRKEKVPHVLVGSLGNLRGMASDYVGRSLTMCNRRQLCRLRAQEAEHLLSMYCVPPWCSRLQELKREELKREVNKLQWFFLGGWRRRRKPRLEEQALPR